MTDQKFIWVYDDNRRVYRDTGSLRNRTRPVIREHYRKHKAVTETTKSFVLDHGVRVPKKTMATFDMTPKVILSEQELDEVCWVAENRHDLCEAVRNHPYFSDMKAIAALVGYVPVD